VVIFLPAALVPEALSDAHGKLFVGHDGIYKMKEHLLQVKVFNKTVMKFLASFILP
jgi:hypothetical protein